MIAVLKHGTTAEQQAHLISWLQVMDLQVVVYPANDVTLLGLIGNTAQVDMELLLSMDIISSVKRVRWSG